jgi:hypothetical protein
LARDVAVREAYGMGKSEDPLASLLALNQSVAAQEEIGIRVVGPGLPPCVLNGAELTTTDCIEMVAPDLVVAA